LLLETSFFSSEVAAYSELLSEATIFGSSFPWRLAMANYVFSPLGSAQEDASNNSPHYPSFSSQRTDEPSLSFEHSAYVSSYFCF